MGPCIVQSIIIIDTLFKQEHTVGIVGYTQTPSNFLSLHKIQVQHVLTTKQHKKQYQWYKMKRLTFKSSIIIIYSYNNYDK